VLWLARPSRSSLLFGVAIALAGEALRAWAAGHLSKSREVTSSGPYRWLAHPLYVGSSVMGLGLAVAAASIPVALIITVYLAVTITAAVRHEESFLRQRFGHEYAAYRDGHDTRRPASAVGAATNGQLQEPVQHDQRRRFSVAQLMANREHRSIGGLAIAVVLLLLKAMFVGRL
jgi:hypothetical protein